MRIAIMATGAVGGYFGARLSAAGHEVAFIARGQGLEAIRARGLKVESVLGDLHLTNPIATDDPAEIGPVDIVVFAVKLWDLNAAAARARPLVGPDTCVVPLQNGVDSTDGLATVLGRERVAAGCAYIATTLAEPGVVRHTSPFARVRVGRLDGRPDAQLQRFTEAAAAAGIDIAVAENIERELWQKFVFLVGLSGATATMRSPIGPIRTDPDARAFFHGLMQEVVSVALAKGVALSPDFADDRLTFADQAMPGFKASMLHDLERGNRLELDWLAGRVVQFGRALGVPTPKNEAVYAMLKLHRMGAGGASSEAPAPT